MPQNHESSNRAHTSNQLIRWLIFLGISAVLALVIFVAIPAVTHRSLLGNTDETGGALTVGITDAPQTLDIRTTDSDSLNRVLIGNVYRTLLDRDKDNKITAGLASSWTTSDDGLTLTFTLRNGIRFANGHPLDASNVVWSLQQAVTNKWPGADTDLAALASVTNPNATTVVISLKHPDATLPRTLSGRLGIVYDSTANIDYTKQTMGAGPYTVHSFKPGKQVVLTATDGSTAKTSTVTFDNYADDQALMKATQDGGIDLALPADPASTKSFDNNESFRVDTGTSESKVVLLYNNDADSIFSDEQARMALRMILDKTALAKDRSDVAQVLGGPIGPLEPGYEDLTGLIAHNADRGRQLINYFASSYVGTLKLVTDETYESLANQIAQQLQEQGISVEVSALGANGVRDSISKRNFHLLLTTVGAEGTASFADPNGTSHYTNADAQAQYTQAVQATTQQAYEDGLKTYARTVSGTAASDWLYARKTAIVASTQLAGYSAQMVDERLPLANIAKQ
ncbi:ABC transporter substrate-binding protein [Bifidobacterium sp. 64T4]|nr:ABC transporter substrate-binding protein [Bifidobacterium pongonis]